MANILIIEKDLDTRQALQEGLIQVGHHLYMSDDVNSAQKILDHTSIDLIITEFIFPKATGLDFLNYLLGLKPKKILMVMVGANDTGKIDYVRKAKNMGIEHVHPKPIVISNFLRTVQSLLSPQQ